MFLRIFCLAVLIISFSASSSHAFYISEIFADPAVDLTGDANSDGISSAGNDEFLEFFNDKSEVLDLSGWYLNDALKTRHVFPANSIIPAQGFLVVFGGGAPNLPNVSWQLASTGTLSLNNTAETLSLFDNQNQLMEQLVYGADGGKDQSLVRSPEGYGETFVLHTTLENANGRLFSPGYALKSSLPIATVPEGPTLMYFLSGLGFLGRFFNRRYL